MNGIDATKLEEIRSRNVIPSPGIRPEKYLEMEKWLGVNIRRIRALGLDLESRKLRMFDMGSGAGYFLHLAKCLGHKVLGLDIPDLAWYGELTELLGVPRVLHRINAFESLPDLGEPFDYVTAFMICFNNHSSDNPWGVEEWRFFLDDLWKHLRPGAVVWLELNRGKDGTRYTPELKRFFEERGALVDGKHLIWGVSKLRFLALQR